MEEGFGIRNASVCCVRCGLRRGSCVWGIVGELFGVEDKR